MGAEDDRWKSMTFDYPEHIPVSVSLLPASWMKHRERLEDLVLRHPVIFEGYETGSRDFDEMRESYTAGDHVDEWGCVWSNIAPGCAAMVKKHPVPTRADVHRLKPPQQRTGFSHGFMYLRLCDLRGFEEIMVDFAEEPPELQMLIDIVLDHNMKELEECLKDPPKMMHFGDDLGMQTSLPMSPEKWRKYLKPCYARIYGRCHEAGCYVYMHSDGHMIEIIADLIECGINVINPQIRANGLDNLVEVCKGKVCVNLDLDRQMLPFCTADEVDAHVHEAVEKLGSARGGLWLSAECGPDVPLGTIEAICRTLEKYRDYYSRGASPSR